MEIAVKKHVLTPTTRLRFEEGEVTLVEQGQLIILDATHNGMCSLGASGQPPTDGWQIELLPHNYVESDLRRRLVSVAFEMTYELCPVLPFFGGHFVVIDGGPNVYNRYRVITKSDEVGHLHNTRVMSQPWFDVFDQDTYRREAGGPNARCLLFALVSNDRPGIRIAYMAVRFWTDATFEGRFFVPFNFTHGVLITDNSAVVVEYKHTQPLCGLELSLCDACLARLG